MSLIGGFGEKFKRSPGVPETQKMVHETLAGVLELLSSAWTTIEYLTDQYGEMFTEADIDRLKLLDLEMINLRSDVRARLTNLDG